MLALQQRPQASQRTAQEEALRGQEAGGQVLLEEADAGPAGADGAGDEERHAQDGLGEAVEGGEGGIDEGFVAGEREDAEDDGEEAGDGGEGLDVVGDVGAGAGRVVGVKQGAGEVFDGGVGGRGDWGNGR